MAEPKPKTTIKLKAKDTSPKAQKSSSGPTVRTGRKPRAIPKKGEPLIVAEYLSKAFGKDAFALDDVSLEIREGEFVSLVGRSGAGKSTLTNMIIGEERLTEGRLFVNGWNVSLLKRRHIPFFRRQIGVVFQDFKLLSRKTVFENVAFALVVRGAPHKQIMEDVPRMLALVGLAGKEERFPHELSGGEKQRVAIARAFVHRPKLLVADEPTGNLDALYAWEIIEVLLKINELGTTVLLATHDRDIVNRLHRRVITLDGGRLIRDQEVGEYVL
ncbi:MAG: ATP-binding cassette domain-containing protein [Candidatus Doudnabacteria bacterium]|nr:ATP-binding cassette domain-containing protein [Candidatus Doudnabacteria bacterium]